MEAILFPLAYLATALALGGMVFFALVTAPLVFMNLDEENAGKLIRAIFPWYYLYVIVTAGFATLTSVTLVPYAALGLGIATLGAIYSRQTLMPRINGARDQAKAGDDSANERFERLHQQSVKINGFGLAGVVIGAILLVIKG